MVQTIPPHVARIVTKIDAAKTPKAVEQIVQNFTGSRSDKAFLVQVAGSRKAEIATKS